MAARVNVSAECRGPGIQFASRDLGLRGLSG